MNITLYISNYDKTDIVKTFVSAKTWAFTNGQLRFPTNVLNPIIRVDFTGETITDEQKSCINYAYIPAFNRYYFIENIVMITSTICDIYLHVDVLYTYIGRTGSPLRSTSVFVERCESTTYRNSLYPDERINIQYFNTYQYEQLETDGTPPLKFKGNGTEDSGGHGRNITVSITYNNAVDISFNMTPEVTINTESNLLDPRYHATGSGFVVYVLTKAQLVQLLREFLVDDTKASYVRSICIWPFDLPTGNLLQDSSTGQLKYGNNQTFTFTGDVNQYVYRTTDVESYKYFSITNFTPNNITVDTFLKMNGYATWSMYLPYIGWVDYDSSIMLEGKKLEIFYDFNFDTATCECHVFFNGKLIINKDCDMGIKVPVNSTNKYEIEQRQQAIATQGIATFLAGLIMIVGGLALSSTGAGAAAGGPMAAGGASMVAGGGAAAASAPMILGGGATLVGGLGNMISQGMQLFVYGTKGNTTGGDGLFLYDKGLVIRCISKFVSQPISGAWLHQNGYIWKTHATISSLRGYAEIAKYDFQLECLPQEQTELQSLLMSGVHFPSGGW